MSRGPFTLLADGRIDVRMPSDGIAMLARLVEDMSGVIAAPGTDAAARLFPRAYEDEARELAFQERSRERLIEARTLRLETMRRLLAGGQLRRGSWRASIEPGDLHAWIGFCNDARVVLGTMLDVTEDDQPREYLSPNDPSAASVNAYLWLGAVLEAALAVISPE